MEKKFVNFTNHGLEGWEEAQIEAAEAYGPIVDLPFPEVDPAASEEEIEALGMVYCRKIQELHPEAVLCQGEFTLAYAVIRALQKEKIRVVAACTRRQVQMVGNEKRSRFQFVRFREYQTE